MAYEEAKMYYLMNKDNCVAKFSIEDTLTGEEIAIQEEDFKKLPVGFDTIVQWIYKRKASEYNSHLQKLMISCGCHTAKGFIRATHAASLNDTFWVKEESEDVSWEKVSLYGNPFDEIIGRMAFEGVYEDNIVMNGIFPDFTTEGSFRKCWKRENDGIYLYKQGSSGARNAGLEPYCEVLATELAAKLCPGSISYDLVPLYGQQTSKCKLFTNEKTGYVPMSRFAEGDMDVNALLTFYSKIGAENEFRRMVVLDAVVFNVDRHMGNYGVLVDNDTLEPISMAPVFDLNLAMLPYVEQQDFENLGRYMMKIDPCIGGDFVRIGQELLTPEIRSDLTGLRGFRFQYRGCEKFPEERVKVLEQIVNKQIEAVLSKEVLYTKDVFISDIVPEDDCKNQETLEKENIQAEELGSYLVEQKVCDHFYLNDAADHIELVLNQSDLSNTEIYINMKNNDMWVEKDGIELSYADCSLDYPAIMKWYTQVSEAVDNRE